MASPRIDQLNAGLDRLHQALSADAMTMKRVEVGVITFGGEPLLRQPFATVDHIPSLSGLTCSGGTPMGAAVTMALQTIELRKQDYRAHGIVYLRPWLWIITDGAPTDDIKAPAAALKEAEARDKVIVFTLGVDGADFNTLSTLGARPPLVLHGLDFPKHFEWLGNSLRTGSTGTPDGSIRLTTPTAASVYPLTVRT